MNNPPKAQIPLDVVTRILNYKPKAAASGNVVETPPPAAARAKVSEVTRPGHSTTTGQQGQGG
jgi:hypothetical protein